MNQNGPPKTPIDLGLFEQNRRQVPPDYLIPYWGKQVAWNAAGTQILASGDSPEDVDRALASLGIPFEQIVYDFIDDPNVSYIG
jgi:hypothetical protein